MEARTANTNEGQIQDRWDGRTAGIPVRLRDNPGRQGTTTGKTRQTGTRLFVQIDFGSNDKLYKPYELIEPVCSAPDVHDLLDAGSFGGPSDLRRILTFEKIKGELTNVLYSMEASNTVFFPHQFKPVLKFIESSVGRLLIADEVGLGKTIESIYIWKELQARNDARRLLVVCPAMLREKWRSDLRNRFNIASDIVGVRALLQALSDASSHGVSRSFTYIASLEALRPPTNFEDPEEMSPRAKLGRLLDENTASEEFALFDLVIFDEAHYLRNPTSASNRLGRLLREAAHHMVLLTATPIQIASNNLYQLIRLIDPDEFPSASNFDKVLKANAPVVNALRCLWRQPPDLAGAGRSVRAALANEYFEDDEALRQISDQILHIASDPERRVEIARTLENRSLLGHYMVRNRKREVLEAKARRSAQVLNVQYCSMEQNLYEQITLDIRKRATGLRGASLFPLIVRQRQMASSLVAALRGWNETGLLEELLWEDLGYLIPIDKQQFQDDHRDSLIDLETLEAADTKYLTFRNFLAQELRRNPGEKFVVFAFFRPTLQYLARRLESDGIRVALIMGGMGDATNNILREFSRPEGPSVLLSSEVGSEGIDLQFCRFVVNYDLPWNPMRVEQRIGRLDRLGQKAERIIIVNLVVANTIEDQILQRLYDRINLFQESIGDLEEILGDVTEQLVLELLNPNLTPEERERDAELAIVRILNRRKVQDQLESEAVNLLGFSDYILDSIRDSRNKGRWLGANELIVFVDDYFARRHPGTTIESQQNLSGTVSVRLPPSAKAALGSFIQQAKPATRTRLHQSTKSVLCLFDPRRADSLGSNVKAELIEPTHPLIQWIRAEYAKDGTQFHPVSATQVNASQADISSGDYAFAVHRWSLLGLREEHVLAYRAIALDAKLPLDGPASEALVTAAARHGNSFPNALNVLGDLERVKNGVTLCEERLYQVFDARLTGFEEENTARCRQQETSARKFAERRVTELRERLARFRTQGKLRPIPMTEALLNKEETELQTKLNRIDERRKIDADFAPMAIGVIRVG